MKTKLVVVFLTQLAKWVQIIGSLRALVYCHVIISYVAVTI